MQVYSFVLSPYPYQCHIVKILNMPSQSIEIQLSRLGITQGDI